VTARLNVTSTDSTGVPRGSGDTSTTSAAGGLSLSTIVAVAVARAIVAPIGVASVTVNVSGPSTAASSRMGTVNVADVW
jgi:hypothetical protein